MTMPGLSSLSTCLIPSENLDTVRGIAYGVYIESLKRDNITVTSQGIEHV